MIGSSRGASANQNKRSSPVDLIGHMTVEPLGMGCVIVRHARNNITSYGYALHGRLLIRSRVGEIALAILLNCEVNSERVSHCYDVPTSELPILPVTSLNSIIGPAFTRTFREKSPDRLEPPWCRMCDRNNFDTMGCRTHLQQASRQRRPVDVGCGMKCHLANIPAPQIHENVVGAISILGAIRSAPQRAPTLVPKNVGYCTTVWVRASPKLKWPHIWKQISAPEAHSQSPKAVHSQFHLDRARVDPELEKTI